MRGRRNFSNRIVVGDVQISRPIESQPSGSVETCPVRRTIPAPGLPGRVRKCAHAPRGGDSADDAIVGVRDKQVPTGINGDIARVIEPGGASRSICVPPWRTSGPRGQDVGLRGSRQASGDHHGQCKEAYLHGAQSGPEGRRRGPCGEASGRQSRTCPVWFPSSGRNEFSMT